MALSFYTRHSGALFVSPGGQSEPGGAMAQAGFSWGAVNVADGHLPADWQTTIVQLNASGLRCALWGRAQNMPIELIMALGVAARRPVILNIEDEFKSTSPAVFEKRIRDFRAAHPTWTREIVINTVGWLYNDVDYRPIAHRPVLLQVMPADMKFDPSLLPQKTADCISHARINLQNGVNLTGFKDIGVQFQADRGAVPSWYDFWKGKPRAYWTGDAIAHDWARWPS